MGGEEQKGGTVKEPLAITEVGVDREWTETGMRPSRRSFKAEFQLNQVSWLKAEFEPKKGELGGTGHRGPGVAAGCFTVIQTSEKVIEC